MLTGVLTGKMSVTQKLYKGMKKLIRNDAEEKKCITGYPQGRCRLRKNGLAVLLLPKRH